MNKGDRVVIVELRRQLTMHSPPLLLLFDRKSGIAFSDHHFKLAQEMMVSHRRSSPRDQNHGNHLIVQGKLGRVLALYSRRLRHHFSFDHFRSYI